MRPGQMISKLPGKFYATFFETYKWSVAAFRQKAEPFQSPIVCALCRERRYAMAGFSEVLLYEKSITSNQVAVAIDRSCRRRVAFDLPAGQNGWKKIAAELVATKEFVRAPSPNHTGTKLLYVETVEWHRRTFCGHVQRQTNTAVMRCDQRALLGWSSITKCLPIWRSGVSLQNVRRGGMFKRFQR